MKGILPLFCLFIVSTSDAKVCGELFSPGRSSPFGLSIQERGFDFRIWRIGGDISLGGANVESPLILVERLDPPSAPTSTSTVRTGSWGFVIDLTRMPDSVRERDGGWTEVDFSVPEGWSLRSTTGKVTLPSTLAAVEGRLIPEDARPGTPELRDRPSVIPVVGVRFAGEIIWFKETQVGGGAVKYSLRGALNPRDRAFFEEGEGKTTLVIESRDFQRLWLYGRGGRNGHLVSSGDFSLIQYTAFGEVTGHGLIVDVRRGQVTDTSLAAADRGRRAGQIHSPEATVSVTLRPGFHYDLEPGTIKVPLASLHAFVTRAHAVDGIRLPSERELPIDGFRVGGQVFLLGREFPNGRANVRSFGIQGVEEERARVVFERGRDGVVQFSVQSAELAPLLLNLEH